MGPKVRIEKSNVCVLIPAYNEEKRIAPIAEAIKQLGFPLLVVDDGSSDKTADQIRKLGVFCLAEKTNQGKGASLRKGFEWCLERDYSAVIMMDADGQHDPDELEFFLKTLNEEADFVVGNRMASAANMPWVRRLTN